MLTEPVAAAPGERIVELLGEVEANGFAPADIELADEAVALARSTGDSRLLARALSCAQQVRQGARHWAAAIECGVEAGSLYADVAQPFEEWRSSYWVGQAFFQQCHMGEALRWFERAGALADEMGDVVRQARCLNMTGAVLASLRNYQGAEFAYERALTLCDQVGALPDRLLVVNNRVQTLLLRAQREMDRETASREAGELLKIVAPEFLAETRKYWPGYCDAVLDTAGQCHILLGNWQKAIDVFHEILREFGPTGGLHREVACRTGIAAALLGLGRHREAVEECAKFTEVQIGQLSPNEQAKFHRVLAEAFKSLGCHQQALDHFSAHHELYRLINDDYAEQYASYVSVVLDLEKSRAELAASRRLAEELKVAKQFAEDASKAKSEFLSNMSHELRTPLNAVIGFSEIIMCGIFGEVQGKYREYVSDIHKSGEHLLELINQLLDISKAEAGKLELSEEAVDFDEIVKSAKTLLRERANAKNIALTDSCGKNIQIWVDPLRIKQCLINLLSNAVEFTPTGGRITIGAEIDSQGLRVTVADTGVGLAPEDVPKAFERFGQGGNGRAASGTGLGLPLTRQLMELHGGSADLTSVLGGGTTVTLRLPAERILASAALEPFTF